MKEDIKLKNLFLKQSFSFFSKVFKSKGWWISRRFLNYIIKGQRKGGAKFKRWLRWIMYYLKKASIHQQYYVVYSGKYREKRLYFCGNREFELSFDNPYFYLGVEAKKTILDGFLIPLNKSKYNALFSLIPCTILDWDIYKENGVDYGKLYEELKKTKEFVKAKKSVNGGWHIYLKSRDFFYDRHFNIREKYFDDKTRLKLDKKRFSKGDVFNKAFDYKKRFSHLDLEDELNMLGEIDIYEGETFKILLTIEGIVVKMKLKNLILKFDEVIQKVSYRKRYSGYCIVIAYLLKKYLNLYGIKAKVVRVFRKYKKSFISHVVVVVKHDKKIYLIDMANRDNKIIEVKRVGKFSKIGQVFQVENEFKIYKSFKVDKKYYIIFEKFGFEGIKIRNKAIDFIQKYKLWALCGLI